MRAGAMRHRITLQQRSTAQDALGEQSTDWSDLTTIWSDITPASGRELFIADGMHTEVSHVIRIRYQDRFADPKYVATLRAVYVTKGVTRIFNIHACTNAGERNFELQLMCSEGLNPG